MERKSVKKIARENIKPKNFKIPEIKTTIRGSRPLHV